VGLCVRGWGWRFMWEGCGGVVGFRGVWVGVGGVGDGVCWCSICFGGVEGWNYVGSGGGLVVVGWGSGSGGC